MRRLLALLLIAAFTVRLLHSRSRSPPSCVAGRRGCSTGASICAVRCWTAASVNAPDGRICVWPGPIDFEAGANGAQFAQNVEVLAAGVLPLPGDQSAWPLDVTVDGRAAPVVERDGRPHLRLPPGMHRITGRLAWSRMPEAVRLPGSVSLVALTVNGVRVALPERAGDSLRLGAVREQAQVDQLDVQIYRKLTDSVPGLLHTRLTFNVAGRPREELVGPLLPAGFAPMQTRGPLTRASASGRALARSGPAGNLDARAHRPQRLGARDDPPAGLRRGGGGVELRGRWTGCAPRRSRARAASTRPRPTCRATGRACPPTALVPVTRSPSRSGVAAPARRTSTRSRLSAISGGTSPARATPSRISSVDGCSRTGGCRWRNPTELQGARKNGQPLLVTRGEDGRAGVEVRTPDLGIEATGRVEGRRGALPASGWTTRLASLGITLRLPPGHRLLAAPGVDSSPSAWLDRWRLLDIFAVLLVAAVAFRVAGVPAAALSLAAFTLTHHELPALTWAALNLLIAIALVGAMPEGRVRRWLAHWRAVSLAVVVVMLVPFALSQARLAFFPQLEPAAWQGATEHDHRRPGRRAAAAGLPGARAGSRRGADVPRPEERSRRTRRRQPEWPGRQRPSP